MTDQRQPDQENLGDAGERFVAAVKDLADTLGYGATLRVLADATVMMAEKYVKYNGEDPTKQITLEGDGSRTFTIHEDKS